MLAGNALSVDSFQGEFMARILRCFQLTLPAAPTLFPVASRGAPKERYSVCLTVAPGSVLRIGTTPGEYSEHQAGDKLNWEISNLWDLYVSGTGRIDINIFSTD